MSDHDEYRQTPDLPGELLREPGVKPCTVCGVRPRKGKLTCGEGGV